MVFLGLFSPRYHLEKSLVEGGGVLVVEGYHLDPRLTVADHLEGIRLDPFDKDIRDGR